jgi:hypothetical protein
MSSTHPGRRAGGAEPEVIGDARYDHLRVRVRSLADAEDAFRLDEEVVPFAEPARIPLPFDTVLAPERGDPARRYEVVVTAEGIDDRPFVSTAAISGYVPDEVRVLYLRLTAACRDVVCGAGLTCRRSLCESSELAPTSLSRLLDPPPDVALPDAGVDAPRPGEIDGGSDAAIVPDAHLDLDAADLDAQVPPDALAEDASSAPDAASDAGECAVEGALCPGAEELGCMTRVCRGGRCATRDCPMGGVCCPGGPCGEAFCCGPSACF